MKKNWEAIADLDDLVLQLELGACVPYQLVARSDPRLKLHSECFIEGEGPDPVPLSFIVLLARQQAENLKASDAFEAVLRSLELPFARFALRPDAMQGSPEEPPLDLLDETWQEVNKFAIGKTIRVAWNQFVVVLKDDNELLAVLAHRILVDREDFPVGAI